MTVPSERTRAVLATQEFLLELMDAKKTPRVPHAIRSRAIAMLRHYPTAYEMGRAHKALPDMFGPVPPPLHQSTLLEPSQSPSTPESGCEPQRRKEYKCHKCGWVHMAIPLAEAQASVAETNDWDAAQGNPSTASINRYFECFQCGAGSVDFVPAGPHDAPRGATIQAIVVPGVFEPATSRP